MATTTFTGGTISVPVSSILEALGNELTEAERTALFQKLIGFRINEVQPGDLIRSALFNQMLGDINDLAIRVAKLESATDTRPRAPVITRIEPQVVRTDEEFTAFGENLDPNLLNRIDVEDTGIPLFRIKSGSSPTQLVLDAPVVMGLPAAGGPVILQVSNAAGTAQGRYVQLPGVSSQIKATAFPRLISFTPNDAKIKPATFYDYEFELDIRSTHDEEFVLVPQIGGTGWSATVKGSPTIAVTSASSVTGQKATKVITVKTGAAGTETLVLNLRGTRFPAFSMSLQPTTKIEVAATQEIPTSKIQFRKTTAMSPGAIYQGNTLSILKNPAGGLPDPVTLSVNTLFVDDAIYTVGELSVSTGWTAVVTKPLGPIDTNAPGVETSIKIEVRPTSATAAEGQVSFTVSSDTQLRQIFTAKLSLVTTLPQ